MSAQLCAAGSWGIGRTASVDLPHPWLRSLGALVGSEGVAQVAPYLTQGSQRELRRVANLPQDWDGAGSATPRPESVANAAFRLTELCRLAMAAGTWVPPHISASEAGEITFEWWNGARKLTLYFGDQDLEVLRSWGTDVDDEMELVRVSRAAELALAWAWLYGY